MTTERSHRVRPVAEVTSSIALIVPLVVLLVQQFTQLGWGAAASDPARWAIPCCDYSALELGTRAYVNGEQWMGLYSRQGWRHPGPAPFLWDALFRVLPGHAFAEHQVAVVTLALIALVALIAFAWRHTTTIAALAGLAALSVWMLRFDLGMFREPWNPITAMLWVAIFIVCASTFAATPRSRRSGWAIIGAAISGSMAAQSHAGAAPVVVIGIAMVAVVTWRARDARVVRRGVVFASAAAVLLWALPLFDLVAGDHGLWHILTVDDGTASSVSSWTDPLRTAVQIIGLGPAHQAVRLGPASPFLPTAHLTVMQVVAALFGAALATWVLVHRRRHRRLAVATALSLGGLVVTTVLLMLTPSAYFPYLLLPMAIVGPLVWMCGVIAIASDLRDRVPTGRVRVVDLTSTAVLLSLLAVSAVLGVRSLPHDTLLDRYLSPSLLELERSVLANCDAIPADPIVWVEPGIDWTVALPLIATIDRCAPVKVRTWESFLAGESYRAPDAVERDSVWILPVDAVNVGAREIASDGQVMVLVDPYVESVGSRSGGRAS